MKLLRSIFTALGESIGIFTVDQFRELLISSRHSEPICRHRATVIQSRVFFFSVVFAVLVPAWSLIDLFFLPHWLWIDLLVMRLVSGILFVVFAWQSRKEYALSRARLLLAALLAITPLFYLTADYWIHAYPLSGQEMIAAELYELLPFIMVAGLTLFPLTLLEFFIYAIPLFAVTAYSTHFDTVEDIPHAVATLWLFTLILGVALFASLTQLRYMLSQATRASYDALTGMLTRRAGIEMLDLQFRLASMNDSALSILYFDLDNFKKVNDSYGHDAGDSVLKFAAQQFNKAVRQGDSVIRWGGEEFIVVLPTADYKQANEVVVRIMRSGIGLRPDGSSMTASVGVVELQEDRPRDWKTMVELADRRMYEAKGAGRARSVGVCGQPLLWTDFAETGSR
jgi:diguanylate cyclase (GGDEF)-like protein